MTALNQCYCLQLLSACKLAVAPLSCCPGGLPLEPTAGTQTDMHVLMQTAQMGDHFDVLFNRGVLDMHMMVSLDGAERSQAQWSALLATSGFRLDQIVRTRCTFSIIKAIPSD